MVPNFYLSAFAFTLTLVLLCLVELVGSVRDRTNLRALTERSKSSPEYRLGFLPPLAGNTEKEDNDDLELLDIVLVASVDGKFHALNRTTGHSLWSMASSSDSESVPSTLAPLVRTTHVESDPDLTDDDSNQELYVIEPQSGDIFVMASPASPLQRLPFSMSQLVDMSPFSFSGDEDNRVFVGRKETSLLLIELETGKVKATINSECPWNPFEDLQATAPESLDLDELESGASSKEMSTPTEVFIGRTDYHISIHTRPLTSSSPRPPVQNLSFSTYGPNNQDGVLQSTYRRTTDDAYIQSGRDGEILSFKTRGGDDSDTVSLKDSQLLWGRTFSNPIVAVFDVLQSPGRQQPFVLVQPRPRIHDVPPRSTSIKSTLLSNMESAYVGLVEETGSLFAMSPSRFPLVVFGDVDRGRGWLIDAPPGMELDPADLDLPLGVDSVTKARKVRELCRNGSPHRKCLTGVRPLEASSQSRLSRLLDGAPSVPLPLAQLEEEERASNSGDVSAKSGIWNNRTVVMPWITVPGRNTPLFLDGPTNALSALGSFVVAVALCVGWFVARNMKYRGVVMNKVNEHTKEDATALPMPKPVVVDTPSTAPSASTNSPSPPSFPAMPLASKGPRAAISPVVVISQSETPLDPKHASDPPDDNIDGDESDRDGDGDVPATPGKRRGRRGRRGKKKKVPVGNGEAGDDHNFGEKAENGNTSPDFNHIDPEPKDRSPTTPLVVLPKNTPVNAPSLIISDTVLGFGSHGTVVFRGSLQGRSVAVKRLLQDFVTLASREVSILQESDDHPNVIRYYYQEAHANFLYIALELCPASLADIIESPDQFRDISVAFDPKRALRQIASGLRHLHALKLVHRDIKPQNILVSSPNQTSGKASGYRMLISDFGLCKKLDVDQTSFLPTAHGAMAAGTVGWRAPEILRGEVKLDDTIGDDHSQSSRGSVGTVGPPSSGQPTRLTKSVDIFSLGCLFYYTLTNGGHPFGDRFEREVNILKNAKCLDGLERFGEEGSEAVDLITEMLNPEAYGRPDTTTCLLHPFFWDPGRRLTFLQDASDRFEIMCRDPREPGLVTLETGAVNIVGNDWHSRLDKLFIENLGKFRKYDGKSVQDLLRALRNKKHHYQDMPENIKRHLGPMPEGYLSYFTRRFPRLFLHVHSVVAATSLHQESMFRSYFELAD